MSDWNIRAAKELGLTISEHYFDHNVWNVPEGLNIKLDWDGKVRELKFTTSYDWAMLGVNNLTLKQFTEYDGRLYDIVCKDLDLGNPMEVRWAMSTATPEQITRAWVELLEAENG